MSNFNRPQCTIRAAERRYVLAQRVSAGYTQAGRASSAGQAHGAAGVNLQAFHARIGVNHT
jgi:hypothetical protein